MAIEADNDAVLSLAGDFPAATDEQWLKLLDKVLAGAPFEKKLVSKTYDGIAIRPLYTEADWKAANDPSGLPGGAPFVRGTKVLGTARDGWTICQVQGHPDPATANAQILQDLENGVGAILLKLDTTGRNGVAVQSLADLEKTLHGVYLDLAPVVIEGYPSLVFAAQLIQLLQRRGHVEAFAGNLGLDLISAFAAQGRVTSNLPNALNRTADMAAYVAKHLPNARTFNAGSRVYHSAGASEAQELGAVLAAAVEYLRAMTAGGMDIDAAVGQIAFTLTTDADLFLSVAKIRALRKTWARIAEMSGAAVDNRTAPIGALTAPRMMSRRDPWVNILRTTVACFAAGIAGADVVTALPFDNALGLPSDLSRRIARNTQTVLQEESGLARVIDPAGGAWMFETLTEELAQKAWTFFQEIERAGGMTKAVLDGFVAAKFAATHAERTKNLARRKDPLTGVSEFPHIHETPVETAKPTLPKTKTAGGVKVTLPQAGGGQLAAALVEATATADIADIVAALKGEAGASITPLPEVRLAEDFERLRDAGDAFKDRHGARPKVFLASVGTIAEFTARATFAKNFYEAGGFETVAGAGGTDADAIARDFKASRAAFAVMCSTDANYATYGASVAKALKGAGATVVHMAGRGGDNEAALKTAGVDDFIFIGCDVLGLLAALHDRVKP